MIRPEIKERLFRWVAVPALLGVLILLAILQYKWSGQVSVAARAHMQSSLQNSLFAFRQDFARELASAGMEIRSAIDSSTKLNPADFKDQWQHWQQTSPHPAMVANIYIWQGAPEGEPLRFDPARGQFEHANWSAAYDPLRQHLEQVSRMIALHDQEGPQGRFGMPQQGQRPSQFNHNDRHQHADGRENMHRQGPQRGRPDFSLPWAVDQTIPALIYPVRQRAATGQPSGERKLTWLVIELNKRVLEKEVFPELAQKYFRGDAGLDYHVAVRDSKEGGEVIYSSGAGFGENTKMPVDAVLNLFGMPFGRADMGPEFLFAPLRPGNDRPMSMEGRGMMGAGQPRFEVFNHSDDRSVWQVQAEHKSGSVEAAVSSLRRRNLMASFGVLGVLAITMGLILIASQRARKLARLQMDFVAGVSHELRTPLAVISSAAENIAHGVVEDKQQLVRYGNSIVRQTRQLTQLVEQVLLFASTQQSQRRYGLGPVSIAEAVDAALEGTSAIVHAAGFTVEKRVEAGLPAVSADFGALVQCLQNLITNAVKYGGENHWLRVSATSVKEKGQTRGVELAVEDKGIGISKDEMKHIFEPFYRSPSVTESGIRGTGLGLPLARTIVEAMGGRLTAESELGKGSLFTIHLQTAEERHLEERETALDKPAGAEPGFSA
ncbi:MAG TPA: HAMP domain-containing sensor histidine kinase [Candidatus Angelobacter sp.]|nr:HAMP domain-containing sensor histidine kinase [Candidatus Angelobacter sp.]